MERYREEKQELMQRRDRQIEEFKFIHSIMNLNTLMLQNKVHPAALMAVEKELAGLNYETIGASFTLDYWRTQFGENMIVPVLCDVMSYFLRQFQVKEMLTDVQVMQIATRLLVAQPRLRIAELVFVLNEALKGTYGPTYQRIGIDTLLEWLNKFYEGSAGYLETKRVNIKPEDSRGEQPWKVLEDKLKRYETEQREKKSIAEKVWGIEKQKRKVQEHKDEVLKEKA